MMIDISDLITYQNFNIPSNLGKVISSSTFDTNKLSWGAEFAVDGILTDSNSDRGYFLSEHQDYPWFQLELTEEQTITSFNISTKLESLNFLFEIRAGLLPLEPEFLGEITQNDLCTNFSTRGSALRYEVNCRTPILAKFVTIQIMNESSTLAIDEITYSSDELDIPGCIMEGTQIHATNFILRFGVQIYIFYYESTFVVLVL